MTPETIGRRSRPAPPRAWPRAALAGAAFVYVLSLRTHGITEHFWLFGDQMRDWTIARGRFADLPLVGTPQHVGGYGLGPIFYWVLWSIRVAFGPWFDNLPHAGGVGLAVVQSAADAALLAAVWTKSGSAVLAVAAILLLASAPYDLALSSTIWNPVLASALVKFAAATALTAGPAVSRTRTAVIAGLAWLAAQAHLPALFAALGLLLVPILSDLVARRHRRAAGLFATVAVVVLLLQVPYAAHGLRHPDAPAGSPIADSLGQAGTSPGQLRLAASARTLVAATEFILFEPWQPAWTGLLLAAAALAILARARRDRDPTTPLVTVAPLAAALVGFAVWTGAYDHYFYLSLMPAATLTLAFGLVALGRRVVRMAGGLACVLVLVAQPARLDRSQALHRLPEYGPLLRASRQIVRRDVPVRAIEAPFLPAGTDPHYLFTNLGGRLQADADLVAVVSPAGLVSYRRAP